MMYYCCGGASSLVLVDIVRNKQSTLELALEFIEASVTVNKQL